MNRTGADRRRIEAAKQRRKLTLKLVLETQVAHATKISFKGSTDLDSIYLYNDGCVPTHTAANMTAYLKRLAALAKLKVG